MVKKVKSETTPWQEALQGQAGAGPGVESRPAAGDEKALEPDGKNGEEMKSQLEEAEKRAAENYDKYLRAVAELDNYKKRAVREKADAIKYGNENLLRDILPLVDNMDRALEHASNSTDFEAFKEGLRLLRDQFLGCLQKHGVEPIHTVGKDFDPNVHEAMLQVDSDQHEASQVVGEFERGYLLSGRLLRPAKVSVCKRSEKGDPQDCKVTVGDGQNN
ncbi:MAG: nucleotide exchange factor GrpE [Deltaproteobacteria bacterium]|nr:nucleotide exchange factor GrpE [Deltaproteobacteria bacterium]